MSEPKLISPLLDGFAMGSPISDHDGIRCCPAIRENSDNKYIVKIIAIPPSQKQLDALLLAGAYRDPADAMDYYRRVGEDIMEEAELLRDLSKISGFLSYEDWQMEPITRGRLGYEVYLVGSYKRSLDKYVRRNPVTHLEAVNLGLDLCAALGICRQAGALYVDLKPANIFLTEKKEYRIGDLGFVKLDAMSYTALPDKYRSVYTPPELFDPMAPLNMTLDTYAVGMILYQLYNDGQLPFKDKAPEEALPAPLNADYELAAIIGKAIDPDPEKRFQDPKDMGKALVEYMQKNAVNDVSITPHTPLDAEPEEPLTEEDPDAQAAEESTEALSEEADETAPGEEDADSLQPHEMSDELSRMILKADDLISHEAPEGVVVPEVPEEPPAPDPFAFAVEDSDDLDDIPLDPIIEEPRMPPKPKKERKTFGSQARKKRIRKLLNALAGIVAAVCLAIIGLWFYKFVYIQTVEDMTITGGKDQLTVSVQTQTDESLLTVVCADSYGNTLTAPLSGGTATFSGLQSDTMYRVYLEISGFHSLEGKTSDIFTTEATTNIAAFTAIGGAEDGSVILSFTADGEEPESWILSATAEGEEERRESFTGHTVTLNGLTVGKRYTLTLENDAGLSLSGDYTMEYVASKLIFAQDVTITSTGTGDITVHWNPPGDTVVESWSVRCYSDTGYEEKVTVTENQVEFTGVDPTASYTVEVTAAGMTQPSRASITANPINITAFHTDESDFGTLALSWDFTGNAPQGGWLLMYSIDGVDSQKVIKCESPSAEISPRFPGAKYQFTVQAADSTSIFGNVYTFTSEEAPDFEEGGLAAEKIEGFLLKNPEEEGWLYDKVGKDAFTKEFAAGDRISMVLHGTVGFELPETDLEILFVIEDTHGNVLPDYVSQAKGNWKDLWFEGDYHYGELDVPMVPETPGSYVLTVYFNGGKVASMDFSIS